MEGPAETAAEEPAPTGRGPVGPSGGSGDRGVQRAGASASVIWQRTGPEEAKSTVGSGECGVCVHPAVHPTQDGAVCLRRQCLCRRKMSPVSIYDRCGPPLCLSRARREGQGWEILEMQPWVSL